MSIFKNFLYNSALTISTYLINFLIFPYISRVLGVDNIGLIGYVDNIINYFILFSTLGIQTVGIREIASVKSNKVKVTEVFNNLISFQITALSIVISIYLIFIFFVPSLSSYKQFLLVGLGKLLFMPLMIEWLFIGYEDFRYITIRSIIIKILYLVSVFIFVRNKSDVFIYFLLTSLSFCINSIVNIISSHKYLILSDFKFSLGPYIKSIIKLGLFLLITSLYSTFNYVYLGSVSLPAQVGFYYTAIKLYDVIMQFFRAYTSVAMPRMSEYVSNNDNISFQRLIDKSYNALFSYTIPMIFMSILLAPFIVKLIAGEGYEQSVVSMRIIIPVMIISGINQINGIQILMPLHKDNVLLITGTLAAIVGIIFNVIFDPSLGAIGASVTVLMSELTGCIGGLYYTIKNKIVKFPTILFFKYLLSSFPYLCIYHLIFLFSWNITFLYLLTIILFAFYFYIQQVYICHNELIFRIINKAN